MIKKQKTPILLLAIVLILAIAGTVALAVQGELPAPFRNSNVEPLDIETLDIDLAEHGIDATSSTRIWPLGGALIGLFEVGTTEFTRENAIETTYSDPGDGSFSFEDIPWGIWWAREIAPPNASFQLSEEIFVIDIRDHEQVIEITLLNIYIRGNIVGRKVDNETGEGLAGATIGLFRGDETEFTFETALWTVDTCDDGDFGFFGWGYGAYQIYELSAPETHILSGEILHAYISYHGQIYELAYELVNTRIRGSVRGLKLAVDTFEPLQGAVFGLFAYDEVEFTEETALELDTSDELGEFGFEYLERSDFLISEIAAPDGFILTDEVFPVSITEHEEIIELVVENEPKPDVPEDQDVPKTGDDTQLPWWPFILSGITILAISTILAVNWHDKKKAKN